MLPNKIFKMYGRNQYKYFYIKDSTNYQNIIKELFKKS